MNKEMVFYRGANLNIIEGDDEIVLRKGFIHINEICIDKKKSSAGFIKLFRKFIADKHLSIADSNECYSDFIKLARFGLIEIGAGLNICTIVDDSLVSAVKKTVDIEVYSFSDVEMSEIDNSSNSLLADKESISLSSINGFDHIYYIGLLSNLRKSRMLNSALVRSGKDFTIALIDEDDIYMAGIKEGYSGCYSCIEQKIISRFPGYIEDYKENQSILKYETPTPALRMLCSLVETDQRNIAVYGSSPIMGGLIHFYLPNYEYSFEANRKSSSCKICSGLNSALFEEQNIRSINILERLM